MGCENVEHAELARCWGRRQVGRRTGDLGILGGRTSITVQWSEEALLEDEIDPGNCGGLESLPTSIAHH